MHTSGVYLCVLDELQADLFSHHASPLEVYVFVAVDERGDVVSAEICRRCNGKQQQEGGVATEVCSS